MTKEEAHKLNVDGSLYTSKIIDAIYKGIDRQLSSTIHNATLQGGANYARGFISALKNAREYFIRGVKQ